MMGYTLTIGEPKEFEDEDGKHVRVGGELGLGLGAPLNSSNDHSNSIHPSYTGWHDFCVDCELMDVFYGKDPRLIRGIGKNWVADDGSTHTPLLAEHPGVAPLTEAHYREFACALELFLGNEEETQSKVYNHRRLQWLVWWTRWALDNCNKPSFGNS